MATAAVVHTRLLDWYAGQGRDLPWRRTREPYAILVAEIMLQQTQVDRVIPKWHAWLERFPTLADLARASRADAIRAWQGLGYNLRAVRLHAIACQVVAEHGGVLPRTVEGLLGLKGVGRYTAGAVACFAYEQPVAMVDTNVRRVLSRVFGVERSSVEAMAQSVVPIHAAYAWHQALMDLGATLCRVREPLCLVCPLLPDCAETQVASGGLSAVDSQPAPMGRPVGARRSQPAGAFAGSSRFYRGRVLDLLARLPVGARVSLADLRTSVGASEELVQRLALDGLVSIDRANLVGLPE